MFTSIQRRALGASVSAGASTPRVMPCRIQAAGRVCSAKAEQPTLQQEQEAQLLQAAFNASLERIVGAMPGSEQQSNWMFTLCVCPHSLLNNKVMLHRGSLMLLWQCLRLSA